MEINLLQFRQRFIEDASRLLDQLEGDLIKLEVDNENQNIIEAVFRAMHTLKGVSSMYGFDKISEITHLAENIYDKIRSNTLKVSPDIIQKTLTTADYIRTILNETADNQQEDKDIYDKVISSLTNLTETEQEDDKNENLIFTKSNDANFDTWKIIFNNNETIIKRNINLMATFKELFAMGECKITQQELEENNTTFEIFLHTDKKQEDIEDALFFIIDYCEITKLPNNNFFMQKHEDKQLIKELIPEKNAPQENIEFKNKEIIKNRINVDAAKLDELMYLVTELITTNSQLILASKDVIYNPLRPIFEKIDKLSKQFRNNTLSLRLVPLNELILKFQRLVRDLSIKLAKDIELVTQGTETELDKSTIDALADPIMHLIRNCIDHGIETPEVRKQNNKPTKGIIKITAFHSGNFVFIQVQDDGKGIDIEKVRQKAIEKKIITQDNNLSDKEIYELLFLPGFSTAENLTQLSGRGVGMDVVKKKITELRGQIEISSEPGLGTSFTIKIHQTIAILDTMLFKLEDMFFMVPLSDVEECRIIDYQEIEKRKYSKTIAYNEQLIPYIDLYSVFKLNYQENAKVKLLIINRQENIFCFAADTIIGEHQAVLKSLGQAAKKQPYIAVASILGDGNLAYLLDMNAIQNLLLIQKKS